MALQNYIKKMIIKISLLLMMAIMNKHFKIQCSEFLPELDYKPCEDYKEIKGKIIQYNIKHNKPIYDFNSSKKTGTKYKKLLNKCNKYKKTAKKRQCNLDEYIKFSGAEYNTTDV
jgi:hypothetical protein